MEPVLIFVIPHIQLFQGRVGGKQHEGHFTFCNGHHENVSAPLALVSNKWSPWQTFSKLYFQGMLFSRIYNTTSSPMNTINGFLLH